MNDPKDFLDSVIVEEDITLPMELLDELEGNPPKNEESNPISIRLFRKLAQVL